MSDDTQLIVSALENLHQGQQALHDQLTKVLDDHEMRLRNAEASILSFKTVGSGIAALAAFFGWDSLKRHLPWLLR